RRRRRWRSRHSRECVRRLATPARFRLPQSPIGMRPSTGIGNGPVQRRWSRLRTARGKWRQSASTLKSSIVLGLKGHVWSRIYVGARKRAAANRPRLFPTCPTLLRCHLPTTSSTIPRPHAPISPSLSMPTSWNSPRESVVDRFLRYVRIDTQSKEDQTVVPSTPTQWALANMLAEELEQLGATNVRMSEFCMVYASIPGNTPAGKQITPIGFISHVDTSPAVTGASVNPTVHVNYQGGDIILPNDTSQVITVAQNPILEQMLGDDIITTDGTTLLGSDDKAGVATIMTMIDVLMRNPEIQHGPIAIGFTADEEVGIGIEKFDVDAFGAEFAYTVDG